ncbi:MAG: hypothetical protein OQK81_01140 [Candidatus Bathyarchaeota archaeon]|nr:hypothetical protein [Candidatus Bathyarchaeota archaeon]
MLHKKTLTTSLTVLAVALMLTFSVSVYAPETPMQNNMPPDMPTDATQYNRSDMTPTGKIEQVKAMNVSVFIYKNVTMMMNTTQNCEMNVTIDPQLTNKVVAINVDPNQTMTLAMNYTAQPPNGEAVMERALNFYMGLEPNAELQLQAQLRLLINQTELETELGRVVNASSLTWMYWNQTQEQWTPVESHMDENGYLVCNTEHFSTWTVAEVDPEDIPEGIHLITVIGLVIAVTVATTIWKQKKPKHNN